MNNKPNPTQSAPISMRVLIRLPSTATQPSSSPSPPPLPPLPDPSPACSGVVVVGFIGRRHDDISQLLNRIIDADVFGWSGRDVPFDFCSEEGVTHEVREWFRDRRISYWHDEEKGMVFLQMSSTNCPAMRNANGVDANLDFDSVVDELEFRELQGLLFMFTVCHVIIYTQEGSCFDTHVLKRLRVLQSAKHGLPPFLRSHNILPSVSRPPSSSSRPSTTATASKSPSPRHGSGTSSRNSSSISVMSGLGSYTALFPGQCAPVTLFAFIDDFSDLVNNSALAEESLDSSFSNQSVLSSLSKSNMAMKGSSSVVMLSRATNKFEGSLRKKLQSCLEAQIRFLIKRCRTLSGFESGSHVGPRNGTYSGSAPLLTLDASRAVVLLDSSSVRKGDSLDFTIDLLEEVLNGKVTSDSLLLESHSESGNREDIITLKEFVFRQADLLRGKGGLVTNANNNAAAGVGMIAVAAAAAAAASAASGRSTTVPELPSLQKWLSSSQLILKGILSAKHGSVSVDETDIIRRKSHQCNGVPPLAEGVAPKIAVTPDNAVSLLEGVEGMNRKFSALWCERMMPAAMEVYLQDLPHCYPTSQHEAQLEKAIHAFNSMVKGPSVELFIKKLKQECISIWKSGRQLCDAVSLTGKQCIHKKHEIGNDHCSNDTNSEHSSGFVFLHACACGRSRQLRPDAFDFESANIKFNAFPDCDKLLPMLQLPKTHNSKPWSWTVVRLGGAKYYDPSKGLLQTGFASNHKFLLKWAIVLEKDKRSSISFANALKQGSFSAADAKLESTTAMDARDSNTSLEELAEMQTRVEKQKKDVDISKPDRKKISFGSGLPNITMRKAFSEVVAGSTSSNSAFPPLQPNIQSSFGQGKSVKKNVIKYGSMEQPKASTGDTKKIKRSEEIPLTGGQNSTVMSNIGQTESNPFLQIGSNVVPLNVDDGKNIYEKNAADGRKVRFNPSLTHFVVYVGFEHECPHGHRFILSPELLEQLGHPYSLSKESHGARSMEVVNRKHRGAFKIGRSDGMSKGQRASNSNATIIHKTSNFGSSGEIVTDSDSIGNEKSCVSRQFDQTALDPSVPSDSVIDVRQNQYPVKFDSNGPAFSLLNRNLPIYMNCPHCRVSKSKKDRQNLNFAGTISQLQRIFVITPSFPMVLATNPVVRFEGSCQPALVSTHEQQLHFSLGCQVILPPESFVSIRLPFIYGVEVKDKVLLPLNPFEHQPELTAWIEHGTALQVFCKGSDPE